MRDAGPANDDELHEWVVNEIGVDIPRVRVCPDHKAPFELLADLYFERVDAALALANRGGAKTFIVAVLHFINATYKPGCEGLSFGATEGQGRRCYGHIEDWCYERDPETGRRTEIVKPFIRGKPLKSHTVWKTGSAIEVVAGSENAVSGPHPAKAHADEIDLMDRPIWNQAQPVDTIIPTPLGWRRIGDLVIGDEVFGRDGATTRVIKVNDLGIKDVFEIELTDGRKTWSCEDHLWVVAGSTQMHRDKWTVRPLWQLIESGISYWREDANGPRHCYRFGIPQGELVGFNTRYDLPVDPYVLGVILGDGFLGRTDVSFRSTDDHIVKRVNERLGNAYRVSSTYDGEYAKHRIIRDRAEDCFTSIIAQLGLSGSRSATKFIPEIYKRCDQFQRLEMLRGLFDADGSVRSVDGVIEFWTISERLARDAQEIVLSLGGRAIMRAYDDHYTLDVTMLGEPAVSLPRKVSRIKGRRGNHVNPRIKSVSHIGSDYVRCIGVDNDDGTYRTNDYIVTHNSRGMAVTNRATGPLPPWMARFGGMIPPQDIATSTRNSTKGLMQELIDEIAEDLKNGDIPQFWLYVWCIWETLQEVPHCRNAPKEEREARLAELGRDPKELCHCQRVVKGVNHDGSKRTLQDACGRVGKVEKGHEYKGFRGRGWKPYGDLVRTFKRNTPGTWLLQHECRAGRDENVYIENWNLTDYGIRDYEPHPAYGPIYQGVDWGTTHPAAVLWFQYLTCEVPAIDFEYQPIWLQPQIYVLFKEIYIAGKDAEYLAQRVVAIEDRYQRQFRKEGALWKVTNRFCDPAGAGERITFANHGLLSNWPVKTRNKERMINTVQNLVIDDRFAVDVEEAPKFCEEVEIWQRKPDGKELDKWNHAMAAWRYGVSNAEVLQGRQRAMHDGGTGGPSREKKEPEVTASGKKIVRPGDIQRDKSLVNYGGIAASGGTDVPLDPRFALNTR